MGMPHVAHEWTADMVRALPDDGKRYEVVDGELLVTPAPRSPHQRALSRLFRLLDQYVNQHGIGELLWSPADLELDNRNMVQPDLFVLPLPADLSAPEWPRLPSVRLAIEVLSPSTARHDRFTKRRLYQRAGVPEYWIVDLDARSVERWRPEDERAELVGDVLTWQPDPAPPPLAINLSAYFAGVLGAPPPDSSP